ncbi:MAG: outer membrane protein assembly factor BamD, partial [Cyclobacteriaceae bacterium]|nr:outer membrane protein assembly factor BamD [Cyclobacteriaceae bacterium]
MLKLGVERVFTLAIIIFLFVSCTEYRRLQKSSDWKEKYEGAMRFYEAGDYFRSIALFEEVLPVTRGKAEGEKAQFYYAYAHYNDRQYILSAHYFKTFYETYSRSEFANEAQFMYAYSLYQNSPIYTLDQTSTSESIEAFQIFINRNADSKFVTEASQILRELQVKLETKAYHSAKLYHKIGILNSAVIAFDNFAINYPDSRFNSELQYLKIEAAYMMANQSIPSKQKGRYKDVIGMYEEYIEDFPESNFIADAQKYYDDA